MWNVYPRDRLAADAAGIDAPKRVALVCSAGRGKTTNMSYVKAHIAAEKGGKQAPFLIRLDYSFPEHVEELEKAVDDSDSLLAWLALRMKTTVGGDRDRHRSVLVRYRNAGRITLLLDGLDHVMDRRAFVQKLANLFNGAEWRSCPLWISGRPEAFKEWGRAFFEGHPLRVFQVDPLGPDEIDLYVRTKTGFPWQHDFPPECRHLLATPRTLGLICEVLKGIKSPPRDIQAREELIKDHELHTAAGIYYHAYFHPGDGRDPDTRGLLAQGLIAEKAVIGNTKPALTNLVPRIRRMGLVLGAIAFQLLAKRLEAVKIDSVCETVGQKLERMVHGTAASFEDDVNLLYKMDNHTLDFSLFNTNLGTGELSFDNRTVRAFFAAYYATRHGCLKEDLPNLKDWIVDKDGKRLTAFDEFWTFGAEMPDRALRVDYVLTEEDMERWMRIFTPCYTPPAKLKPPAALKEPDKWVQWHRQMVYHSFASMKTRSPSTIASWRARTPSQAALVAEIEAGFKPIAAGSCQYGAAPEKKVDGREIHVPAFRLHQIPTTNRMYEAFDPAHREDRWVDYPFFHSDVRCWHPLVAEWRFWIWQNMRIRTAWEDDDCPVVNVTWYDAWCFAAWVGDHVHLPSELEWEHACRKGTAANYYFGNDHYELPEHAWFWGPCSGSRRQTERVSCGGAPGVECCRWQGRANPLPACVGRLYRSSQIAPRSFVPNKPGGQARLESG